MMSIAIKTIVPQRPIAAALATPWTVRAAAKKPGRNAARTPPASTIIINASELTIPAGRTREANRRRTTAAAVTAPTMAPLMSTWRNSDRSVAAVVVEGIGLLTSRFWRLVKVGGGCGGPSPSSTNLHNLHNIQSTWLKLGGKHIEHREIGYRPRG